MFAGLPGIGVGTLFYVLTALWMPVCELGRLMRGDFDGARWRLVFVQLSFAVGIVASIALADRVLALALYEGSIRSITPARLINEGFATRAPESFWAAPIAASLLLLIAVLLAAEGVCVAIRLASLMRRIGGPSRRARNDGGESDR
jgi:hypothetical protein